MKVRLFGGVDPKQIQVRIEGKRLVAKYFLKKKQLYFVKGKIELEQPPYMSVEMDSDGGWLVYRGMDGHSLIIDIAVKAFEEVLED